MSVKGFLLAVGLALGLSAAASADIVYTFQPTPAPTATSAPTATATATPTVTATPIALPLTIANGGTGVTLAGTGGANQVLQQVSSGANITVGTLDAASIATGTLGSLRGGTGMSTKTGIANTVQTSVLRMTVASNTSTGVIIFWRIDATDGTDYQTRDGITMFSCYNKAGTVNSAGSALGAGTSVAALSTGTQTVTLGGANNAGSPGSCDFTLTSTSSLSSPTTNVELSWINLGTQAVVVL